jgi:hypothetical protein
MWILILFSAFHTYRNIILLLSLTWVYDIFATSCSNHKKLSYMCFWPFVGVRRCWRTCCHLGKELEICDKQNKHRVRQRFWLYYELWVLPFSQEISVLNILRKQVFCGNLLGQIFAYSINTGILLAEMNAHCRQITAIAVAPESAYVLVYIKSINI